MNKKASEIALSFHRVTSVRFASICHLDAVRQRAANTGIETEFDAAVTAVAEQAANETWKIFKFFL